MVASFVRIAGIQSFALALVLGLGGCVAPCAGPGCAHEVSRPAEPEPPALIAADWPDLPGWQQDHAAELLPALLAQCAAPRQLPGDPTGAVPAERLADGGWWQALCAAAGRLRPRADAAARAFLEQHFRPAAIDATGLLTGYFEPVYPACPERQPGCATPVRARPPGVVDVDVRQIDPAHPPRRIQGCVDRGALSPCPPRAAIEAGALPEAPVLAWMDPVDKFFMQIQGSGRLALADGATLRLGYAAQNGAPYVPIGRVLLERGELSRPVSMQSIRAWLAANPDRAEEILNANPSYVFFRLLDLPPASGPIGSMGVPLTPWRSVAVDPRVVPLGLPVFLAAEGQKPRLALAQDTGGAIRGPARADMFTGTGAAAGEVAGRMVAPLRLWLLLPHVEGAPRLGEQAHAR
jgi:membrane-bound lytic murein transglycosylase A